ncbi:multidrug effflux MFS transporter [Brevibacterium sp. 50QC2O2]|uniref:multidrug effflux MFS transporter n=1 Tax=Brevibacterium TaxID=1696 RepID=UPI00211BE5B5|nr:MULTISPECIES: multidrug effflux MFS transporter [unclassified Brevibacterium]MCQ9367247.1 multidrug effflux MFS transporter [Brevibacterium sp. 91QC2O2]MCQ9385617.1 multidrug effflux MFS transporter [Brevibacterium sp. 68QC2CO]MCQ9389873.1 multidrug effflux MFS transporter [Brevibacterium sp. 50QC2O2]
MNHPTTASGTVTRLSVIGLITLAVLNAAAPLSTDLYLSALPDMVTDLHTTTTGAQLSLTAFLLGSGVGQVIFGPWSDRKGRMVPLVSGLVLYLVASIVSVCAPSVAVLVIARLLQGIGASSGMVIGRAMILDLQTGAAAAKALNVMVLIGGVAPVIAPLLGSTLAASLGWRGLLAIVAALAAVVLIMTFAFLRESLPAEVRAERLANKQPGASKALGRRHFVGNLLSFGFAMGVLMGYISASPFIYQQMIGMGHVAYGLMFAVNAVGMMIGGAIAGKLAGKFPLRRVTLIGELISAVGILAVVVLTVVGAPAVTLIVPLFVAIAPLGLVLGNSTALAMGEVPAGSTGMASALLGLLQFVIAGVASGLVGIAGESTLPLAIIMAVSIIVALTGLLSGRHAKGEFDPGTVVERPATRETLAD